ncbi:MAG: hypothetical protein SAL70_42980 [Scytonema sp. PMC 1070.18]|nr:hypothetical protein [Scytonema sp. PMC 1070.18]
MRRKTHSCTWDVTLSIGAIASMIICVEAIALLKANVTNLL